MYANRISFADRDIFARYAAIGVGHDAVHLRRHVHGLVDDHLAADNEGDEIEYSCFSRTSQTNGNVDVDEERSEGDEDEADEDSDSGVSDGSMDSDFEAHF